MPSHSKSHSDKLTADTRTDLDLLKAISQNPQLLNPKYLECYLGPKSAAMTAPFSKSLRSPAPVFRIFWLDRGEIYPRYMLEQSNPATHKFLAEFNIVLTLPEDVLIKDLSKALDEEPVKGFDENGHPILSYKSKDPTVRVLAYQDAHVVNLSKIALQYSGPILLPPSQAAMDQAIQHRRNAALEHARLGRHDKATSLLRSHLQNNPNDAEAHLQLADSYKARSCVNQAINEYKTTLTICGNDKEIHDRCIAGLHALKVDLPNQTAAVSDSSAEQTQISVKQRININQAQSPPNPAAKAPKTLEVGF